MFECVESQFSFAPCIRQGSVEAQIMAEDGHADLVKSGTRMDEEKNGRHFRSGRAKNSP